MLGLRQISPTLAAAGLACAASAVAQEATARYGVGSWVTKDLGNHRAVVRVSAPAPAVRVHIPWRRRDSEPEKKAVLVVDGTSGTQLANAQPVRVNRESGDIVFEAATGPGLYYVYYLAYSVSGLSYSPTVTYTPARTTAAGPWLERHGLTPTAIASGTWRSLPEAELVELQAVSEFHRFDPMEVIATAGEVRTMLERHPGSAYLLFPEDRRYPIRMADDLPQRWIAAGPSREVRGQAAPGEYYVFQLGVFAARQALPEVTVQFGDLRSAAGQTIPAAALTCFNLGGTDWLGRPFSRTVSVPQAKVAALWCGLQVPATAEPGEYAGSIEFRARQAEPATVDLKVVVRAEALSDSGDSDLKRLARLRWLNSTIGLDDEVVAPYTPVTVSGQALGCLGRELRIGSSGLPESIRSGGIEILAGPIALVADSATDAIAWSGSPPRVVQRAAGAATWETSLRGGPLTLDCRAKFEFDGYASFVLTLRTGSECQLRDLWLEIPCRREVATYMMGLGRKGGLRPTEWTWHWEPQHPNNMVWIGDVGAGLQCKFKGPQDLWDLWAIEAGALQTWGNRGKGAITVTEAGADVVRLRAATGERVLRPGEELVLRFGLLITPVKPLDPAHWRQRYYHTYTTVPPLAEAKAAGANVLNLHQGNDHNPYINYPFLTVDKLAAYATAAHEQGAKVKIYYTVRELSNFTAELFPLRSLGHEVFTGGAGGGDSWLQEHLVSDYGAAWHQPYANGEVDAAMGQQGLSRWHNYYLEGLGWLIRNVGIDGLYLDGIGYDREIMKRVRKVMDRQRPGCLIDFHSGNAFDYNDMRASPASTYMEHFPYIDSLWFGEMYDYNEKPDYWLVEISGIPFGLYGEMLQGGGNPWRGMLYGMTSRLGWGGEPRAIWKIWDEFGIHESTMHGYWDTDCPVRANGDGVLATVYHRPGRALVALASWDPQTVRCRLSIAWQVLGLDPAKASLYAPALAGFQPAARFAPDQEIPVTPGRGWLFYLDEVPRETPVQVDAYAGRKLLLQDEFRREQLAQPWTVSLSVPGEAKLSLQDGAIAIAAKDNCFAFAERPLPSGTTLVECEVHSGTDMGATWGTGLALLWPQEVLRINLRSMGTFGVDDGANFVFNGCTQPNTTYRLRVRLEKDEVLAEASHDGEFWEIMHSLPRGRFTGDPVAVRLGKTGPGGRPEDYSTMARPGVSTIRALRVFGAAP